jgi:hypothetical protein
MSSVPEFKASEIKQFDRKAQDTIALALILNWSVRWTNRRRNSVMLVNKDHSKKILVPTTNVNANRARSWLSQIATHTPDADLNRLLVGDIDLMRAEPNIARVTAVTGTSVFQAMREFMNEKRGATLTQQVAEAVSFESDDEPLGVDIEVGRRPYMVQRSEPGKGAVAYESKAIEVIDYSDGSTAYGCRLCDRVADKPRSISTHAGQAHPGQTTPDFLIEKHKRVAEEAVSQRVQDRVVEAVKTNPVAERVAAAVVAGERERASGSLTTLDEALAQSANRKEGTVQSDLRGVPLLTHHLRAAMTRSDQARDVAVEITSLDFETRARLAHVILMGKDAETMRAAAESRITEAEQERDAAKAEAEQLRADWDALQDLLGRRPR